MNKIYSPFYCPHTNEQLFYSENKDYLLSSKKNFPIINDIPRFVDSENYAKGFGNQWNKFPKTQLDSHTKTSISKKRLSRCLNGKINKLNNTYILEAGSGAGRFTEILLSKGAYVHSFDISEAVDANKKNNNLSERLKIAQASISEIPFKKKGYDYVICLGVLQHTPSPEVSIRKLWEMVKPGGYLVFDHYLFRWNNVLPPPLGIANPWYRKFVLGRKHEHRYELVKKIVNFWFRFHWFFRKSNNAQRILRRISPLIFYYNSLPLKSKNVFYEWSLLDTHDALTDFYRHYRSPKQIHKTLDDLKCKSRSLRISNHGIEVFCKK